MRTFKIALPLSLALTASLAAHAGGYAIPAENAREIGLSQATVAAQTGPEAVYQNSSALAGQEGLAVSASLEMLYNITTWTGTDTFPGSATLKPKANFPPQIAVSYGNKLPNGMPFGVGAGLLIPGGGSLLWPTNWVGSQRIQDVTQRVYLLQAGGALEPIDGVKIGATILYYRAQETLSQNLNYLDHLGLAKLGLAGGAVSFGVSGEFHIPTIPLVIGVDYRHKGDMTLTGDAHFEQVPPNLASALQDQGVTERVTAPNELFIGASYKVQPDITVMGSYSLERWIVYQSDTFVGDKGFTVSVPRNYKNAYVFRIGAEWTHTPFLPALTLRLGALRSVSPQPTDTVSPSLTDGNSTAISVGAGYDLTKNLRLDVGYQFAFFDTVTASGIEAFPGSYDTHVHIVSGGITWRSGL
ncbi:MAG: outer membrane protein transport protein [Deltaproteobacteria bacterium]|nr:outer membrane protein transport protein [Deltaproteobacteria bacterium]